MSLRSWVGWAVLVCAVQIGPAAPAAFAADGFRWETDFQSACRKAQETNRLVLIHFWGRKCGPCQQMERTVFSQPGFGRELVPLFVAVKIDADQQHDLAAHYGVRRIPCDVIATPQGQPLRAGPIRFRRLPTAAEYVGVMNRLAVQLQRAPDRYAVEPSPPPWTTVGTTLGQQPPDVPNHPDARPSGKPVDHPSEQRTTEPFAAAAPPAHDLARAQPPRPTAGASGELAPQAVANEAGHDGARQHAGLAEQARATAEADRPRELQLPPGCPPLGLDGFCPFTLMTQRRWQEGDVRYGCIHRGRTYLFVGEKERDIFLADPDRYAPVLRGNDPVMALDLNQAIAGRREFAGVFPPDGEEGRLYLFSSEETLQAFNRQPHRYAVELREARRPKR